MAPVELLLVVSAERWEKERALPELLPFDEMYDVSTVTYRLRERVNHGCNRRLQSGADIVKVQHALHCSRLHTPHNGLGMLAKKGCCFSCKTKTTRQKLKSPLFIPMKSQIIHLLITIFQGELGERIKKNSIDTLLVTLYNLKGTE